MFEADPMQDNRLRLKRHLLWLDETSGHVYIWKLTLAVEGIAGAVSLDVMVGNHRSAAGGEEPIPPIGHVSQREEMIRAELASGGLFAHAYRPWQNPDADPTPYKCTILTDQCYSKPLEGASQLESTPMVIRLCQPGGLEETWERLEELYREEFVPALSARAVAIEAARQAEVRAQGGEFAAALGGPPCVAVSREQLIEKGILVPGTVGRRASQTALTLELDEMWFPAEMAQDLGLHPDVHQGPSADDRGRD